jgi:hypothetical protein
MLGFLTSRMKLNLFRQDLQDYQDFFDLVYLSCSSCQKNKIIFRLVSFRFDRLFFWPAAGLNPEPLNL